MPETGTEKVRSMLKDGEINMVTFTSSSTVANFMAMFKDDGDKVKQLMERVDIACIGPITAKIAEENGLKVSLIAESYTIEALTDAIVEYYSED
jgi:uroporphyrinogen III methyltransferase/synthase